MGQSISAWMERVYLLLRDSDEADVEWGYVRELGIEPALAQYSIDRPRQTAVDLASSGRMLPLPSAAQGWQDGWSEVLRIEAPAGETPPAVLLSTDWEPVRDPSTPGTVRLMIPEVVAGETCRIVFTAAWPMPGDDAATDLVPPIGFTAVCSLAAAMVCTALAAEAARDRQGAMPVDLVEGSDRARDLLDAAAAFRQVYLTYIGLGVAGQGAAASSTAKLLQSTRMGGATRRLARANRDMGLPWWAQQPGN